MFNGPILGIVNAARSALHYHALGVVHISFSCHDIPAVRPSTSVHRAVLGFRAGTVQRLRGGIVNGTCERACLCRFWRNSIPALVIAEGSVDDFLAARTVAWDTAAVTGFRPIDVLGGEWSQLLLALGVGPVEVIPLVGSHRSAGVAVNGGLCGYDSINRVLGRIREEHVGVAEGGAAEDENDDGGERHHQVRSDGLEVLFALVELLGPREYTPEVPTDVLDPAHEPGLQRLGGLCFLGHSSSLSVPCLGMGCEMSVSSFLGEARKAVVGRNLVPRGKLTRPSTAVNHYFRQGQELLPRLVKEVFGVLISIADQS